MSITRMVTGARTHLTYKVRVYYDIIYWRCRIYEPYVVPARWFGLIPEHIGYRYVFTPEHAELCTKHLKPADLNELLRRAVKEYEDYKLAWEKENVVKNGRLL